MEENNEETKQEIKEESKVEEKKTEEKKQAEIRKDLPKKSISGMKILLLVMLVSLLIPFLWDKYPAIKNGVHYVLDPSAGFLLNWNTHIGMLIVVALLALFTNVAQKYGTDQETLKRIKEEQKIAREEMKKYKGNPAKLMEFNKKQFETLPKTMDLTMRPIIYTFLPFILLYKWFADYFILMPGFKFLGFLSFGWFYFIALIVLGMILRKILKVY